jgi:parvulin-like peptidyl-prolyl isomerase
MKRPYALLIALVVVALVGTGCASNGASSTLNDAATMTYTVKGQTHTLHVSRARLLSEMRSLVDNEPFAKLLKSSNPPFVVNHDLSADSKLTAIWLTQLIQQATIDELFASRHLHVTAAIRQQAATDVPNVFKQGDPTVFNAFDKKFKTTMTDRRARLEALLASYVDTSDAAGEAYFQSHSAQFGCASGKDVAHILVKTPAEAQAIEVQLTAGASFATLAKAKSTDTGSASSGGALGCLTAGEFVAPFQTAAEAATIGVPTAPVHSSFGYHVILVTKAAPTTYADVKTQVTQALQQAGSKKLSDAVDALFKEYHVRVDQRFGTWGHTTDAQGAVTYSVTEPQAPKPATSRDGSTTTTTVPASATGSP